jgi:toxin YoeB
MELVWDPAAWEDYLYWQKTDEKMVRRVNELIRDMLRSPFKGIGKPELLRGTLSGFWSRRINEEHRVVYAVKDKRLHILQCRFHYDK